MALQLDLATSNFGIPFQGAYFRIVTASVTRQRQANFSVSIDVVGYATRPENDDTKDIDFRRYHAPLIEVESQNGDTFLAKCYNWVAQQSDMTGSLGI